MVQGHPGGNPEANLKSISHRCHPILVVFVWELTKETIGLPLGCLQGGLRVDLALRVALSELLARHVQELAHPRSVARTQEHVSIHLQGGVVRGQCSDSQGHAWPCVEVRIVERI